MPRLAPVIKTLLFAMFIAFSSEFSLPGKCRSHPVKPAEHRKLIGGEAKFFAAARHDWCDKGLAGATGASRQINPAPTVRRHGRTNRRATTTEHAGPVPRQAAHQSRCCPSPISAAFRIEQ